MTAGPRVLLVFPRFGGTTFWSLKEACKIQGARHTAPPLGLLTVAALLPSSWQMRLVDRNVNDVTSADYAWADLVFTGGMFSQQLDTPAIVAACRARGLPVCVGGPAVTSSPHVFAGADFLILGEAEGVIGPFIEAWARGEREGRFEAGRFQVDFTKTPIPRFDLIDFGDYLQVSVQFSRGCPFTCEFCDIIELYGRVPRTKTNAWEMTISQPALARYFWPTLSRCARTKNRSSKQVVRQLQASIAAIDSGRWTPPPLREAVTASPATASAVGVEA